MRSLSLLAVVRAMQKCAGSITRQLGLTISGQRFEGGESKNLPEVEMLQPLLALSLHSSFVLEDQQMDYFL